MTKPLPPDRVRKKMGRPSTYTNQIAITICRLVASGVPLTEVCKRQGMPTITTVYNWLWRPKDHPDFIAAYARARRDMGDTMAADSIRIADECRIGTTTRNSDKDGVVVTTGDMVERARLQVETRKWFVSKMHPERYAEKIQQEVSGPGGGPVLIDTPAATAALETFALRLAKLTAIDAPVSKS